MNPFLKVHLIQSSLMELLKTIHQKTSRILFKILSEVLPSSKNCAKKGSKNILFKLLMHVIMAKILSADLCSKSPTKYP